ncbi:Xaa-Pro peptidase family protein [Paenibacillus sp. MSJ-34]|uniref:M24 family metallopeptidase n=1 Tax=Paenibacillus sp. MSJ-34 TaxID=2841529 RepID=UPI001C10FF36|nr:Xaa-Pro peptidase family protein [Paenibacillus sp. MSJ-34]MBU5445457.1 Xaa-Pro peptidase family protein [Paenibacillus sp. MSJ-34]
MTLSRDEIHNRIKILQKKCAEASMDGCIITQNVDLYYFTGSMQTGYLFIPAEGESVYYVRRSVVRAEQESHVETAPLGSLRQFGQTLAERFPQVFGRPQPTVAAEFDVMPVQMYHRLRDLLPEVKWVDGSAIIRETRMIKSAYEVSVLKEAARIADLVLQDAAAYVRPGMTELELMSRIEFMFRNNGHLGMIRLRGYNQEVITGMVGSGAAAAEPTYFDGPAGGRGLSAAGPQSSSRKAIERGEPILVDIGCCIDGYVTDQTRTFVIGELEPDLRRAYDVAESILRATEKLLRPGTSCERIYAQALEMAKEAGLAAHFMGYGADQVKFLGHGIGLEIDELPVLAKGFAYPLEPGMAIAIEPKFTFPGRGIVGLENVYLITEQGYDKLTVSREGVVHVEWDG